MATGAEIKLPPLENTEWMAEALCPNTPSVNFFPQKKNLADQAIRVCLNCPVQNQCYLFAKRNKMKAGVWGGHYFGY